LQGVVDVLVATDVAARGLDVPEVAHVVQFDLPVGDDFDSYVHRIGRTGRAGHKGRATSLYVHGYDPKSGNSALWADIKNLFIENNQQLPAWFMSKGQNAKAGGGGGGGGGGVRPGSAPTPTPMLKQMPLPPAPQAAPRQVRQMPPAGALAPSVPPTAKRAPPATAPAAAPAAAPSGGKGKLLSLCDKRSWPRAQFQSAQEAGAGWVSSVTVIVNGQPLTFHGRSGKKAGAEDAAAVAALLSVEAGGEGGGRRKPPQVPVLKPHNPQPSTLSTVNPQPSTPTLNPH